MLPDPATTRTDTDPFFPGLGVDPCRNVTNIRKINTDNVTITPHSAPHNNPIGQLSKRNTVNE